MAANVVAEGYTFYIDLMPTDDVQQLNCDQIAWLKESVSWT